MKYHTVFRKKKKNAPLLCFSGLAWFYMRPHAQSCNSLLILNKPILLKKNF